MDRAGMEWQDQVVPHIAVCEIALVTQPNTNWTPPNLTAPNRQSFPLTPLFHLLKELFTILLS